MERLFFLKTNSLSWRSLAPKTTLVFMIIVFTLIPCSSNFPTPNFTEVSWTDQISVTSIVSFWNCIRSHDGFSHHPHEMCQTNPTRPSMELTVWNQTSRVVSDFELSYLSKWEVTCWKNFPLHQKKKQLLIQNLIMQWAKFGWIHNFFKSLSFCCFVRIWCVLWDHSLTTTSVHKVPQILGCFKNNPCKTKRRNFQLVEIKWDTSDATWLSFACEFPFILM